MSTVVSGCLGIFSWYYSGGIGTGEIVDHQTRLTLVVDGVGVFVG